MSFLIQRFDTDMCRKDIEISPREAERSILLYLSLVHYMVKHVLFFYYDSLAKHVLEGSTVMLQQKYLKLFSDKKKEKVPNNCREGNPT